MPYRSRLNTLKESHRLIDEAIIEKMKDPNFDELKVNEMETKTKVIYLETRVQHIEDYLGQRKEVTDGDRRNLWDEVTDIKQSLENIEKHIKDTKK